MSALDLAVEVAAAGDDIAGAIVEGAIDEGVMEVAPVVELQAPRKRARPTTPVAATERFIICTFDWDGLGGFSTPSGGCGMTVTACF